MSEETTLGYVYILKNDAMPGLIKIGKTSRDSAERARELSNATGVPAPFEVAFELSSENYEKLEKEMHKILDNHRVNRNREFFKYSVNKAINLLKKLDTEKQNGIGPEVAIGKNRFVNHILGFLGGIFQPKSDDNETETDDRESTETETIDDNKTETDDRESTETAGEPAKPTPPVVSSKPNINPIIKDRPLQNEHRENAVEPSLNGKPYYSSDNGFACAAASRGLPEGLPDHIGIIIRNEQLEIAESREHLQTEIDRLNEEKNKLELRKQDTEQQIGSIAEELADKRAERAKLKAELETPTSPELDLLPEAAQSAELETPTGPELDLLPEAARPAGNLTKMVLEEKIRELEQEIREKTREHAEKRKELVGLKVELEAPTKVELDLVDAEVPAKNRFSWLRCITAIIATIFLLPLAVYLFIFYASVVDNAFFLDVASLKGKSQEALNAIDFVNPDALSEALQKPGNPVVILFPSIFLAFAIVTHYFWEQRKWILLSTILILTLLFDGLLAVQISQKIHGIKTITGLIPESENWVFRANDLNMWTVIFCGFVVSLLVSVLYHTTVELWNEVRPLKDESKQLETQIRAEKNPHEVQLATLKAEVKMLEKDIHQLNNAYTTCQQNLQQANKHPVKVKIAILKTEMQYLQNEFDLLTEYAKNIEQQIAVCQNEIETLLAQQQTRLIDLKKMDSQVSQFVAGWCRYVTQSETDLTGCPEKIKNIMQIKQETLDSYFKNLRSYSARAQENFPAETGA